MFEQKVSEEQQRFEALFNIDSWLYFEKIQIFMSNYRQQESLSKPKRQQWTSRLNLSQLKYIQYLLEVIFRNQI